MPKYYRVRSQQEWDWLMQWFEEQSKEIQWCDSDYLPTDFNFYHANRGNTVVEKNDKEELYYASLTHYQQDENVHSFIEVSDLMENEKMEKIKFTKAMKKEFNELNKDMSLSDTLNEIQEDCGGLNSWIYSHPSASIPYFELKFARAWTDPSLIDVIPEKKYWVKCYPTDDCYFYKYDGKIRAGVPRVHLERFHFTAKEITDYHLDGNTFEKVEVGDAKEN